jgi:hypothetical protein
MSDQHADYVARPDLAELRDIAAALDESGMLWLEGMAARLRAAVLRLEDENRSFLTALWDANRALRAAGLPSIASLADEDLGDSGVRDPGRLGDGAK